MRIDDRVEPLVREALHAAVKRNEDKLDAALKAFPDNDSRTKGLELATAVTAFLLHDMYNGRPTADNLQQVADTVGRMEAWAELTSSDILTYLTALLDGKPLETVLPPGDVIALTFIVAASLLASRSKAEDGKRWFNLLDRVEAAIESS